MMASDQYMEDTDMKLKAYDKEFSSFLGKIIIIIIPQSFHIRCVKLVQFLSDYVWVIYLCENYLFKATLLQEYWNILKYYIEEVFKLPLHLVPYNYPTIQ